MYACIKNTEMYVSMYRYVCMYKNREMYVCVENTDMFICMYRCVGICM